jgi:hypothetical protein
MRDPRNSITKFFNIYDFFAFLLPGLVFLVALTLFFSGIQSEAFWQFVHDALPDNPWLQGGAVVIAAYAIGLLISVAGKWLARAAYGRNPEKFKRQQREWEHSGGVLYNVEYGEAWTILRDSLDKESYDHCYYLWGLEATLRGLAVSFIFLGIAFWFYDISSTPLDNRILSLAMPGIGLIFLAESRAYYWRMLEEVTRSVLEKLVFEPKWGHGQETQRY